MIRKIYLATAYCRQSEMRGYRDILEALGYQVTSRWIDQHDEPETGLGPDVLNDRPDIGTKFAQMDINDIRQSDTVISFTGVTGRGGRHVELGIAWSEMKFIIIVGPREHVFHTLPGMDWYPSWDSLITNLRKFPATERN